MNDGTPTLEVGFAIETGSSYEALIQLQKAMDTTEAQIVRDTAAIERATGNMLNLGSSTTAMRSFGNAVSKEAQAAARELNRVERAGEGLSRQLDRDAAAFGKTRAEIRATKVESAALAAEQRGLTELAGRLRSQLDGLAAQHNAAAAAAEREAQSIRSAAFAHSMFEAAARKGVVAMREKEAADRAAAAAQADLAARAQRLVAEVNPAAAAQQRFNSEMAEARTLISAGAISLDDYVDKLRLERSALDAASSAQGRAAASAGAHRQAMVGVSYQVQDFFTQISMGANPINAFAVQGGQLAGQFANIEGKAGAVARFFMGPWGLAITAAALVVGALTKGLFDGSAAAEAKEKAAKDLATAIDQLSESTRRATQSEQANMQQTLASAAALRQKALDARAATIEQLRLTRATLAHNLAQAARGDGRGDGGTGASAGSAALAARNELNLRTLDAELALREKQIATTEVAFKNAQIPIMLQTVKEATDAAAASTGRFDRSMDSLNKRFAAGKVGQEAYVAEALRLDRAHKAEQQALSEANKAAPSNASAQRRAERLERDADATEAQTKNLYALAEAYKVSGGAALVAEARVAAESKAIKQRGEIEAMVNGQVGVAIAQRVSDAQKAAASMRDQAAIQEDVNLRVTEGNVAAERAAELIKDRIADLPLLAAAQAAQARGMKDEAMQAMTALADLQAERERLRTAEEVSLFNRDTAAGADRLAELREELRLVGATNAERVEALALLKATQEADSKFTDPSRREAYVAQQLEIAAATEAIAAAQRELNDALSFTADRWDLIAQNVQNAASGMSDAFGDVGAALGGVAAIYANFRAQEERAGEIHRANMAAATSDAARQREIAKYQLATSTAQVGLYGDMASAAKGFFKEKSAGYKALLAAEKIFRAFEFAMSVKSMVQDIAETVSSVANSGARATAAGAEGVANQAKLPFPYNIVAMAATAAALVAAGISILGSPGGSKTDAPQSNTGTGTVLGDGSAQSESIKNSIDALKEVDTLMLNYSRQMASSLRSIENQIGGFASLIVRNADGITDGGGIDEGFKTSGLGSVLSKIPLIGGILGGLFGTKTTLLGSGLSANAQSLGGILSNGFDAQTYMEVQKKKKLFGITTSNKTSTTFSAADPTLENQFTLILREFNNAILAAAGPLGAATTEIQQRLNGFVVNIGKIDLKGLTGAEIEEKLTAVFGAAADNMARAAFPGMERFQRAGEGLFETIVRVASVAESVTSAFALLGQAATGMSLDAKVALADQFETISDLSNAVDAYFSAYYTQEEQAAARTAQMATVFQSLGLTMPTTLAAFRQLVEAQNLNTAAGQAAYATLLQIAPAFAELQSAMAGAKSAADIATERQDLERQLLELRGDTAALRALQLAKLDASNRALQQEIWAMQDAQAAAKAAEELRKAWTSVGDSIMDEVRRIRGLTDAGGGNTFAQLQGQFNAATDAARGGDMDAAKSLPGLSKALLDAAAAAATSRQELDRVRAQIAASLEATNGLIGLIAGSPATTNAALLNAAESSLPGSAAVNDNGSETMAARFEDLREQTEQMRRDLTAALATIAANTGSMKRTLDNVTTQSGGDAIATVSAAA